MKQYQNVPKWYLKITYALPFIMLAIAIITGNPILMGFTVLVAISVANIWRIYRE